MNSPIASAHFVIGAALISGMLACSHARAGSVELRGQMRILGVTLEKTTLEEARDIVGFAEIRENGGDAGAYLKSMCYAGIDGTVVAFTSSDFGAGRLIVGYQLAADGRLVEYSNDKRYVVPEERRPRCAPLRRLSHATTTDGGLRLGMTKPEVYRLLGKPTSTAPTHDVFSANTPVPMTPEDAKRLGSQQHPFYSRFSGVRVEYANGVVNVIRAWQVTET